MGDVKMPLFPNFFDINPEIIDILIKKEREEQNNDQFRPFLQLPAPHAAENPETPEIDEKSEKNDKIIIIDL